MYLNKSIFFQEQRKLLSQTKLIFIQSFDLFLGSKLNFLIDFIRNNIKMKKGLKYFTRIKFYEKEKLKLGKI